MKIKCILLFLLLLCVPEVSYAYYVCHPCCSRFQLPGWWLSADYLLLWRKERFFPPLVTTATTGTPDLSNPATTILFGGENTSEKPKSGGKVDLGIWITRCLGTGFGAYTLGQDDISFSDKSNAQGSPILGRPFFNTFTGLQDFSPISSPMPFQTGRVDINTKNNVWGFDFYARYRFFNFPCFKFDLLAGYFYTRLNDDLQIETQNTVPIGPTTFLVKDSFFCKNNFYSGLAGLEAEWRSHNWGVRFIGKVGVGNMIKKVGIEGTTTTLVAGTSTVSPGGLLAQPSNIGEHSAKKFEVVSQLSVNGQLRIMGHLWLTAGFTYIYWPSVVLAGDQVNLNINPNQNPLMGTPAPLFTRVDNNFWIRGFTAGFYIFY